MEYKNVPKLSIPEVLTNYFEDLPDELIHVIVIGANEGDLKDFLTEHLNRKNLRGILVEPVSYMFKSLTNKFRKNKNLLFENAAIDAKNTTRVIYGLKKDEDLPDWAKGLGSFNKKILTEHENQLTNLRKHVIKEKVNCITLKSLVEKHNFPKINILQIDTEGHDYEIIRSIDFVNLRPEIIIFEYLHLTTYQYYSALALLDSKNYFVRRNLDSFDVIAINKEIL